MPHVRRALATCALLLVAAQSASAQGFLDQFIDPTDGYPDVSNWLSKKGAFLPVPLIVSEPAVGAGGGLAAAWIHGKQRRENGWAAPPAGVRVPPPSISVLGGIATSNGTTALGAGHLGIWREDTVRYIGFGATADANLDFYAEDQPLRFNLDTRFLLQDLRLRVSDSDFFLGARYQFADSDARFTANAAPLGISPDAIESRNAGLGVVASFDDRDNVFTPTRGTQAHLILSLFDEAVGGDFNYSQVELKATHHRPLREDSDFFLGLRFSGASVGKQAPFYAKPFITLRGVPALRFQGDQVASTEAELRWEFTQRWSALTFLGLGASNYERDIFEDSGLVVAGGVGARYLMARVLGVHTGIDLAFGPEGPAVYFTLGSGL